MQDKPLQTLQQVSDYLQVDYPPLEELYHNHNTSYLIESKFPSKPIYYISEAVLSNIYFFAVVAFEKVTSWKVKSDYEPIPLKIAEYSQKFFQPFNEMLFELLGEDYTYRW